MEGTSSSSAISNRKRVGGMFCATLTPYNVDTTGYPVVNLEGIEAYAKMLKNDGVQGVFVNGTSAESMSLSVDERKALAERWSAIAKELGFQIIIHIGAQSVEDSRTLAAHAATLQVDGISCMAPTFFKPLTISNLLDYLVEVTKVAPSTPFFYYYYPKITGVAFRLTDVFAEGRKRIPTFAGAKFTGDDLGDCMTAIAANKDFDVLLGNERMYLPGLTIGVHGAIALAFSTFAPMYAKLLKLHASGDAAAALQQQIKCTLAFDAVERSGPHMMATFKALVKETKGIDLGPLRAPLPTADASLAKQVAQLVAPFQL